jgi:hypothetical protein
MYAPLFIIALLALVVVLLVAALVVVSRRDRRLRHSPLLVEVADYSTGVLACPGCRGTCFQSPPSGGGSFFGLFLFFFVFGQLSTSGTEYAECVVCRRVFRRGGVRTAVASAPASVEA